MVSHYMHHPSKYHIGAVKRIMHHLASTIDLGLLYERKDHLNLNGHIDNDWGGSINDKKSMTGWVFELSSATIAWC